MTTTIQNTILTDNAYGTIASGLAASDTALTFTTGHGARFPVVASPNVLYCCLLNSGNVLEEIKVTAHSSGSDSATIVRGVGGTTAKAWSAGDRIEARLSSAALEGISSRTVWAENFGAVGDAATDNTTAFANAIAASKHVMFGEGTFLVDVVSISGNGYVLEGSSPRASILKARTSGSTKIVDIAGSGSFAQNNVLRNMTLDMTNMTDASTSIGLHLSGTYDNHFEQLYVTGNGTSKLSLLAESSPATFGVYTSTFISCDFGSTTGKIKFNGNGTSDAITTITFIGCSIGNFNNNFGYGITFLQPIIQGALNKFDLANTRDLTILGGDVEGTGTYLAFGSSCVRVMSQGNQTSGFSGTYTSGTCDPMWLCDQGQGPTIGTLTFTMYAGGHSDRPFYLDSNVNLGVGISSSLGGKIHVYNPINQATARFSDNFNNRRLSYVGTSLRQAADSDGTAQPLFTGIASTDITELNSTIYRPVTDNSVNLGDGTHRWKEVFAVAGTINTSDEREKNSIADSDLGLDFIRSLRPVKFKFNVGSNDLEWVQDGTERLLVSPEKVDDDGKVIVQAVYEDHPRWVAKYTERPGRRWHYGFLAQDVKKSAGGRDDFAPFVSDGGRDGLRYDELLAPIVKAVQELSERVQRLEGGSGETV